MPSRYVFVGERRSPKARAMRVRWRHGRLAAKQLFDALYACGLDPHMHRYRNWFQDGDGPRVRRPQVVSELRRLRAQGLLLVAMGKRIAAAMTVAGLPHVAIVHPAARGTIRTKHLYCAHVRSALGFAA